MVGLKSDQCALRGICKVDYRGHLCIVRQACGKYDIAVLVDCLDIFRFGHAVVFPLRDRSLDEASPRLISPFSDIHGRFESVLFRQAGIVSDVGLRKSVVRLWFVGALVCCKPLAHPCAVTDKSDLRCIEDHAGLAAAVVRETGFSEVPEEESDLVLSLLEVRCEIHDVIVCVVLVRTSFESAFEYGVLSVDPKPVLRISGDFRFRLPDICLQVEVFMELNPYISLVAGFVIGCDPMSFLNRCRTAYNKCRQQWCKQAFHIILRLSVLLLSPLSGGECPSAYRCRL